MCLALSRWASDYPPHEKDRKAQRFYGLTVTAVEWNGREAGAWEHCLEGADAVINLAGAPIADGRWTDARKQLLTESRVLTTRLLVAASVPQPLETAHADQRFRYRLLWDQRRSCAG